MYVNFSAGYCAAVYIFAFGTTAYLGTVAIGIGFKASVERILVFIGAYSVAVIGVNAGYGYTAVYRNASA